MNDYHSNTNTWDRHDPLDPNDKVCQKCGGKGGRHDPAQPCGNPMTRR